MTSATRKYSFANLFSKQREALTLLGRSNPKYIVYGGGAGGGKSWLGCEWLVGMASVFPDTRWFIARNTLKRLKESTYKTLVKVAKSKDIAYKYNEQKALITLPNSSEIMLLEVKRNPSDPMFEDLGSLEFTGGFIEEAGEISFDAFDTLKSRIGRQMNNVYNIPPAMLITCNPKKNWLYHEFYLPWKNGSLAGDKAFVQSLVTDNPHATPEYIEALRTIKNTSKRLRLLEGLWEYDDNPYALYAYESILDCFNSNDRTHGEMLITCDAARLGKDTSVMIVWNGWTATEIHQMKQNTTTQLADFIRMLQRKHKVSASNTIVDEDGVGGGVVDMLNCTGFVNNSRPINGENYINLKSQCAFRLCDFLGVLRFESTSHQETIVEELEAVEEKNPHNDGKLQINSRDEMIAILGRSPDFFSAIMMRCLVELRKDGKIRTFGVS